ncbi:GMC family oxidoreductase N-terminal domain-containing protein [Methanobacterium petrolearium]|uniref:GMC family oxidoreductase N-terminal domain-containing protein n=2 Tax=Methanobacterium petrolearium TaxID=710190 RepID=UPI001AE5338D|nr:GMC family oxidoreductase N-terminal domain-containing protein [Methanobacterium petrolearium]
MKAIVVGSGAGGATIARKLQSNGFEVNILEAGSFFKPFTRNISWSEPLRRWGLLGGEGNFRHLFPHMNMFRSSEDLLLVRGITTGGSTVLSCGNIVRTHRGLEEIGLDLTPEFQKLEGEIHPEPFPQERWRPLTREMCHVADDMGLNPQPTPKAVDPRLCVSCGLCEVGCHRGARWDSRRFLNEATCKGATLHTNCKVEKVILEGNIVKGVEINHHGKKNSLKADLVVLSAGGIGTPQILRNSGLEVENRLWADIVLTLGGVAPGARQLEEPPMVWYSEHENYILSPYLDILSHFFHKPWRKVSVKDRVGLMIKLADTEKGSVYDDGRVEKHLTKHDDEHFDEALNLAKEVMIGAGVSEPLIKGMYNGGHLGGTVPLKKEDVPLMRPSWMPDGLWVADLSLVPRSQGMPTILLTAALALRVAHEIIHQYEKSLR